MSLDYAASLRGRGLAQGIEQRLDNEAASLTSMASLAGDHARPARASGSCAPACPSWRGATAAGSTESTPASSRAHRSASRRCSWQRTRERADPVAGGGAAPPTGSRPALRRGRSPRACRRRRARRCRHTGDCLGARRVRGEPFAVAAFDLYCVQSPARRCSSSHPLWRRKFSSGSSFTSRSRSRPPCGTA